MRPYAGFRWLAGNWSALEARRLRYTRSSAFFWTRNVNHRLAAAVTMALLPTRVTPNTVSLIALLCYAPVVVYISRMQLPASGYSSALVFICLQLAFTLDCTDGQLARARGQVSALGGWLDRVFDFIGHAALLTSLAVLLARALKLDGTFMALFTGYLVGAHLSQMFASFYRTALMGSESATGGDPPLLIRMMFRVMQVTDYGLFLLLVSVLLLVPVALLVMLFVYATLVSGMLLSQLVLNVRWQGGKRVVVAAAPGVEDQLAYLDGRRPNC